MIVSRDFLKHPFLERLAHSRQGFAERAEAEVLRVEEWDGGRAQPLRAALPKHQPLSEAIANPTGDSRSPS